MALSTCWLVLLNVDLHTSEKLHLFGDDSVNTTVTMAPNLQDPSLRPWALLALVSGFHGDGNSASNVHEHKAFERAWHLRNGRLPNADVQGFIEF